MHVIQAIDAKDDASNQALVATRETRNRSLQAGIGLQIVFSGFLGFEGTVKSIASMTRESRVNHDDATDFVVVGDFGARFMTITRKSGGIFELTEPV